MEHIEIPENLERILAERPSEKEEFEAIRGILEEAKVTYADYKGIDLDEVYHDINHIHYLMEFPE